MDGLQSYHEDIGEEERNFREEAAPIGVGASQPSNWLSDCALSLSCGRKRCTISAAETRAA
jgi:hypothetical protein